MIPGDTKYGLCAQKEAIHKAHHRDYAFFEATKRGAHQFIIDMVEEKYLSELNLAKFYYTRVHPIEFLDHLQYIYGGLHALELLTLQRKMQNAHKECYGIPEYINSVEDVQDKSKRAKCPSPTQH